MYERADTNFDIKDLNPQIVINGGQNKFVGNNVGDVNFDKNSNSDVTVPSSNVSTADSSQITVSSPAISAQSVVQPTTEEEPLTSTSSTITGTQPSPLWSFLNTFKEKHPQHKISLDYSHGRFYVDLEEIKMTLPIDLAEKIINGMPQSSDVPPFFVDCQKVHKPYIAKPSIKNLPTIPSTHSNTDDDLDIWSYIHHAVMHLARNLGKIEKLCSLNGEVFADMNIWNHVVDSVFIPSSHLTLDRRETEPQSTFPSEVQKLHKYDGIFRTIVPNGIHRHDFGFIEAKPVRLHPPVSKDFLKVEEALCSALFQIHSSICREDSAKHASDIVVIGMVCEGMSLKVLKAWKMLDLVLISESHISVCIEHLLDVLEICWRIKLDLEKSCVLVKDLVKKRRPYR